MISSREKNKAGQGAESLDRVGSEAFLRRWPGHEHLDEVRGEPGVSGRRVLQAEGTVLPRTGNRSRLYGEPSVPGLPLAKPHTQTEHSSGHSAFIDFQFS